MLSGQPMMRRSNRQGNKQATARASHAMATVLLPPDTASQGIVWLARGMAWAGDATDRSYGLLSVQPMALRPEILRRGADSRRPVVRRRTHGIPRASVPAVVGCTARPYANGGNAIMRCGGVREPSRAVRPLTPGATETPFRLVVHWTRPPSSWWMTACALAAPDMPTSKNTAIAAFTVHEPLAIADFVLRVIAAPGNR